MLAEVPLNSPVFTEEVFGPVAPVTRVSSAEEAVRLASEGDYGLSLGIVTRDVMRGLALAEQIPTGIVHINDQTVNDEANVPFGGVGASGIGPTRRRGREHRGVHRDPLDHDARGAGELPVLIVLGQGADDPVRSDLADSCATKRTRGQGSNRRCRSA